MTNTNNTNPLQPEKLEELLADQAMGEVADSETDLVRRLSHSEDEVSSLDIAAGILGAAACEEAGLQPMPEAMKARLLASGREWGAARRAGNAGDAIPFRQAAVAPWRLSVLPWMAAAAGILLAVIAWWPAGKAPNPREDRQALLAGSSDTVTLAWKDWDSPEVPGVTGDVVWSDAQQRGYMRFTNLPAKDAKVEQYQLWIVDSRGMGQRISGGVFNGDASEVVVPIDPGIPVQGAAAFAVTIEKPGGTWVSDMSRRVVIASK